jgi:cytochrome c oxidase assembly protein subunit 15
MNHSLALDHRTSARTAAVTPERRLAAWLLLLSVLVTVLMLWGGIVRLSGSGLSIPDWPIINGSLLPPLTSADWDAVFQTYAHTVLRAGQTDVSGMSMGTFQRMFAIEYIHRLLAAVVGLVFLAVFVRAYKSKSLWPSVKKPLITAAVVLLVQAILGGIVVKFDLAAQMVAVHLGTGFFFLSILFWTALRLQRTDHPLAEGRDRLRRLGWLATGMALLQVMSGGLVAGTGAGLMLNTWPKMGDYWIPPLHLLWTDWYQPAIFNLFQNQLLIQFIHRTLAWAVVIHVILLAARALRTPLTLRGRWAVRAMTTLTVLQVLLGIGNLMMKVPFAMAFAHLATGLALFITLLIITHESVYAPDVQTA